MSYLINLLEERLQLTNDNYLVAKELHEKRYGDKQTKLFSLDWVNFVGEVNGLKLYDGGESRVRSLKCLGFDSENFGSSYS